MKNAIKILLVCLVSFVAINFSYADQVIEEAFEHLSESRSRSEAQKEAYETATTSISVKYIKDFIGESKYERNRELVENKILKESSKYILRLKAIGLEKEGKGYKVGVSLKVSISALKTLLLRQGLLYNLEGQPKVLPVISFFDRVNSSTFSWWVHDKARNKHFYISEIKSLHASLDKQLKENGFYLLNPITAKYSRGLPAVYKTETLKSSDHLFVGEFFKASIVLKGDVRVKTIRTKDSTYKVEVQLKAVHTGNGRVIGEVIRSYETDTGSFHQVTRKKLAEIYEKVSDDMTVQLFDAWKKGTFGANLFQLTFNGDLPYKDVEELKRMIVIKMKDVKSLRERYIESNSITFEVDSSASTQKLAEAFAKADLGRFKVEVQDVRPDGLAIDVK